MKNWILFFSLSAHQLISLPVLLSPGAAAVSASPSGMQISCPDNTKIEWDSFSIDPQEIVSFALPRAQDAVYNYVMGTEASHLLGRLESNGRVILFNPQGVWIGKEAKIETASFLASAFDLNDGLHRKKGQLRCEGSIISRQIELRAQRIVLGDTARLDASHPDGGGSIVCVDAETLFVSPGAQLLANSRSGNGGRIDLWSEKTEVFGHLESKSETGNGGFIEVSGLQLQFEGTASTQSLYGKTGTLLLDPTNIRIVPGAIDMNVSGASPFQPIGATSEISQTTLSAALAGTNVIVQSSPITFLANEPGDVILHDDFTYSSPNSLILNAVTGSVRINSLLSNTGSGSITLEAGSGDIQIGNNAGYPQTTPAEVVTASGSIAINAGNDLIVSGAGAMNLYANIRSASGNIAAQAGRFIQLSGNASDNTFAQIGAPSTVAGAIDSDIAVSAGSDLTLAAGPGLGSYAHIGHGTVSPSFPAMAGTLQGDIAFSAGGQTTLTASSSNDSYAVIGFRGGPLGVAVNCQGGIAGTVQGQLLLNAGTADSAAAQIGFVGFAPDGVTYSGDVDLLLHGPFFLTGGTAQRTSAGIGFILQASNLAAPSQAASNLIRVVCTSPSTSVLTQGILNAAHAVIGIHLSLTSGGTAFCADTTVRTAGSLTLQAIAPVNVLTFIGARGSAVNQTANTNLTVDVGGDLTLISATGGTAAISNSSFNTATNFTTNIQAANAYLLTTTPFAASSGVLIFASGPLTLFSERDIVVSRTSVSGASQIAGATSMDIRAGRDISLYGGASNASGTATIVCTGSSLRIEAGDDIILDGIGTGIPSFASRIQATNASGLIEVLAGNDLIIHDSCGITGLSQVNIVVDNDFPSAPLIGPGSLQLFSGGIISTTAADALRLFTARQSQNNIQGTLSSGSGSIVGFSGGPLYQNIPPELWGVYYYSGFFYPGQIFTLFYKDSLQQATEQAALIVTEFLVDLHPYNEFPGWMTEFYLVNQDSYNFQAPPSDPKDRYLIRRRNLNVINHPKTWTAWLNEGRFKTAAQ